MLAGWDHHNLLTSAFPPPAARLGRPLRRIWDGGQLPGRGRQFTACLQPHGRELTEATRACVSASASARITSRAIFSYQSATSAG